jgi:hypothetical protein
MQKYQLQSLCFSAKGPELLWEMKSMRPLCRKEEFDDASILRGDKFSNP